MKEQYLLRGSGFIGNHLRFLLPDHIDLPRDWNFAPEADHIVYIASYGNYHDQIGIEEIYRANLTEPTRLLNQLFDYQSFVFISTSSVLLPHQTFYSASKKAMEDVCRIWAQRYNKPIIVLRPSSVTGIGEQSNHLIPTLIQSCLYGEEMPFVAEPTHDFIDVADFCNDIIRLSQNPPPAGGIYNASSGITRTNQEVREIVEKLTGKKANVKLTTSLRRYDTEEWNVPNMVFFRPRKPLEQSIKEMIEHERTKKENY